MPQNYNINLNVKYKHLDLIDVPEIVKANKEKWFNQTLTQVNESVVRIGIIEGEFHWHKHDSYLTSLRKQGSPQLFMGFPPSRE